MWATNGAVTRHKADGTESKVLFSYGGNDDLNVLMRGDYYTAENRKDTFINMLIYQDKIYVSLAKNAHVTGTDANQYSAIYAMNLDGTGWIEVVKNKKDMQMDTWCIWNDRLP